MTNEEAIDILRNAAWLGTKDERERIEEAVRMAANALTAQPEKTQLSEEDATSDCISRQDAIEALKEAFNPSITNFVKAKMVIENLPSAQPEPCNDADKLKRCKFEYINACKIVACTTPDTNKSDIYDAYAVIKALHPIFGDEEF